MSTKCHPKNVREKSPKKRTSRGHFCPRDVAKSVHEMSPFLSMRCHLLCPRDVCHPSNFVKRCSSAHFVPFSSYYYCTKHTKSTFHIGFGCCYTTGLYHSGPELYKIRGRTPIDEKKGSCFAFGPIWHRCHDFGNYRHRYKSIKTINNVPFLKNLVS